MTENKRFTKCDTIIRDNGEEMSQAEVRDMLNAQHEEIQQSKVLIKKYHNENTDLIKENEQLKSRIKYLERKIERERNSHIKQHEKWENEIQKENEQLKQFKEKVFVLIDEKIKHYEHKPISAPVGQPMSVNFDADVDRLARLSELQDLKKELKSE